MQLFTKDFGHYVQLSPITIDCKQSFFSQSSLSAAGLERENWPRGKLERGGKKRDCILFCNRRVQISPRHQHRRIGLVDKQ